MKAVFLDFSTLGKGLDTSPLFALLPALECFDVTPAQRVAGRIADADIVFANKSVLGAAELAGARSLRYIGLAATGTDNVDLAAARARGVAVSNIRAYCTNSVAEHVLSSLLALARSLVAYRSAVRAGRWQRAGTFCLLDFPVRELSSMTLGIVGYGELGRGVAAMAERLGMRVLVARRRGAAASAGDGRIAFDELLQSADAISLHCPLTPATRNLIGAAELTLMKNDAFLINTARGGLVDSAALSAALREGRIAGAAIDVLADEPPAAGDPLLDYAGDNLILTPHVAWASSGARQNALDELAANAAAFLDGRERNRVDRSGAA